MTEKNNKMSQAMSVLTSRASIEWYTPPRFIMMVRAVLGGIDIDPASHPTPQKWIRAKRFYTVKEDGLKRAWRGRFFCNPPYGMSADNRSNMQIWSARAVEQYRAGIGTGILLINSTHGYEWYEDIWLNYPVCCMRKRIRFINERGVQGAEAKRGQTWVYFGDNFARFNQVFSTIGRVLIP
jgi:hypothetical protein